MHLFQKDYLIYSMSIMNYLVCAMNYLLKNSLSVKKGAALFKMARVKKVMKSKGWPKNGCDSVG